MDVIRKVQLVADDDVIRNRFEHLIEIARRRKEPGLGEAVKHVLLGLLRESGTVVGPILVDADVSYQGVRKQIDELTQGRPKLPTSVDIPLAEETEWIFSYAAEEADGLAHRHIGTEHLLLGLLHEKSSFAAQLLSDAGVTLEDARLRIAQLPPAVEAGGLGRLRTKPADFGKIRDQVLGFKRFVWLKREWKPLDVLVENETGRVHFDCGRASEHNFKLLPAGWTKDWCAICGWELNAETPEHTVGYTNGLDWICPKCHDAFLDPNRKLQS